MNMCTIFRTALDKMEDARIKAARERVWRHIDMISTNGDSSAMKPKLYVLKIKLLIFPAFLL